MCGRSIYVALFKFSGDNHYWWFSFNFIFFSFLVNLLKILIALYYSQHFFNVYFILQKFTQSKLKTAHHLKTIIIINLNYFFLLLFGNKRKCYTQVVFLLPQIVKEQKKNLGIGNYLLVILLFYMNWIPIKLFENDEKKK